MAMLVAEAGAESSRTSLAWLKGALNALSLGLMAPCAWTVTGVTLKGPHDR